MGRIGVDFEQVKEAAEALEAAGESPTIERVRRVVGQGSFSTLARHLKAWRLVQRTSSATAQPMPDAISEAAQGLWLGLSEAARSELETYRETSEQAAAAQAAEAEQLQARWMAERDRAQLDRQAARSRIEQLEATQERLEAESRQNQQESVRALSEKDAELREGSARLESLREQWRAQEGQLEQAHAAREAAEAALKGQNEAHGASMSLLREDVEQERRRAADRQRQQDAQITSLIAALERGERRLEEMTASCQKSDEARAHALSSLQNAEQRAQQLEGLVAETRQSAIAWQQTAEERGEAQKESERRQSAIEQRLERAERHSDSAHDQTARALRALEALEQKVTHAAARSARD